MTERKKKLLKSIKEAVLKELHGMTVADEIAETVAEIEAIYAGEGFKPKTLDYRSELKEVLEDFIKKIETGSFKIPDKVVAKAMAKTENAELPPESAPPAQISPLDGMSKDKAKRFLYKALKFDELKNKVYSDQSWAPINKIYSLLNKMNIEYENTEVKYDKDANNVPTSKRWLSTISFMNDKGRKSEIFLTIVGAGAGTVEDPLSKYDVVAYVS